MRRRCAGDAAYGLTVATSDDGNQRTVPASSFSPCFSAPPVARYSEVKAMISEGAEDGFIEHAKEPTQIIRWISRAGAVNSTEFWLCNGLFGAFPRKGLKPPRGICFNSTRRKSELASPMFSTLCRSSRPGLTRKAPFTVGGRVSTKDFSSRCWNRTGPESLR